MTHTLESVIATLESIDLAALIDDPAAMALAMIERQHAIDALKTLPFSAVSESERAALRRRLEVVLARDAKAFELLRDARTQIAESLDKLVSGRALARSYGGLRAEDSRSVKRTG
jgi:hypothetical protein